MSSVIPADKIPFVQSLIASGEFQSESQVVGAALSKMEQERRRDDAIRAQLEPAIEELKRGAFIELDEAGLAALCESIKAKHRVAPL